MKSQPERLDTDLEDPVNANETKLATTEDVVSTTEFTMTEPANWFDFVHGMSLEKCSATLDRYRYHFNLTFNDLYCFCMAHKIMCREPYRSMEDKLARRLRTIVAKLTVDRFDNRKHINIPTFTLYGVIMAVGITGELKVITLDMLPDSIRSTSSAVYH